MKFKIQIVKSRVMRKRIDKSFINNIIIFLVVITAASSVTGSGSFAAGTETDKAIIKGEENIPVKEGGGVPAGKEKNSAVLNNKKNEAVKTDPVYIKAKDLSNHPDIILNAYKEAYPALITDVIKGESDWIIKFKNGKSYYWADGKILPESELKSSDKYIPYSIYPYNKNGRSPELYTKEKIEKLREQGRKTAPQNVVRSEHDGLYKELYGVTTRNSVKRKLVNKKFLGFKIKVHKIIGKKISSIDLKIRELAKSDREVSSFIKNLSDVQCFHWRKIAGVERKSRHSFGLAVDILPENYRKKIVYWGWEKDTNNDWMLIPQSSLWVPPDSVVRAFLAEGFIWGGHWDTFDTIHFEYRPELLVLFNSIRFD